MTDLSGSRHTATHCAVLCNTVLLLRVMTSRCVCQTPASTCCPPPRNPRTLPWVEVPLARAVPWAPNKQEDPRDCRRHLLAHARTHHGREGPRSPPFATPTQRILTVAVLNSNPLPLPYRGCRSELVLWLVGRKQFPQAVHLCQQRYQRERAVLEVGNLHACELWRQGQFQQAMAVWAELVLPSAPASYWHVFLQRLAEAGKLGLAVKWLPFNDRSKASTCPVRSPAYSQRQRVSSLAVVVREPCAAVPAHWQLSHFLAFCRSRHVCTRSCSLRR